MLRTFKVKIEFGKVQTCILLLDEYERIVEIKECASVTLTVRELYVILDELSGRHNVFLDPHLQGVLTF